MNVAETVSLHWKAVSRIRFLRSIKAVVRHQSIVVTDLIVCSELNEAWTTSQEKIELIAFLRTHDNDRPSINYVFDESPLKVSVETIESGEKCLFRLRFRAPSIGGSYSVAIVNSLVDSSHYVMPLLSDVFTVVASENIHYAMPMLCNFRAISLPSFKFANYNGVDTLVTASTAVVRAQREGGMMMLKEDYGTTIGSHVYDSAIILLKALFIRRCQSACNDSDSMFDTVIELGAGCGFTGIGLAVSRLARRVVLTDLAEQLPLLRDNVSLNALLINASDVEVNCAELNWNQEHALDAIKSENHASLDVILAADVFYDEDVARAFFKAINRLMTPGKTEVYAAERIRRGIRTATCASEVVYESITTRFRLFLAEFPSLGDIHLYHEEANVIVWKIFKQMEPK